MAKCDQVLKAIHALIGFWHSNGALPDSSSNHTADTAIRLVRALEAARYDMLLDLT